MVGCDIAPGGRIEGASAFARELSPIAKIVVARFGHAECSIPLSKSDCRGNYPTRELGQPARSILRDRLWNIRRDTAEYSGRESWRRRGLRRKRLNIHRFSEEVIAVLAGMVRVGDGVDDDFLEVEFGG